MGVDYHEDGNTAARIALGLDLHKPSREEQDAREFAALEAARLRKNEDAKDGMEAMHRSSHEAD